MMSGRIHLLQIDCSHEKVFVSNIQPYKFNSWRSGYFSLVIQSQNLTILLQICNYSFKLIWLKMSLMQVCYPFSRARSIYNALPNFGFYSIALHSVLFHFLILVVYCMSPFFINQSIFSLSRQCRKHQRSKETKPREAQHR